MNDKWPPNKTTFKGIMGILSTILFNLFVFFILQHKSTLNSLSNVFLDRLSILSDPLSVNPLVKHSSFSRSLILLSFLLQTIKGFVFFLVILKVLKGLFMAGSNEINVNEAKKVVPLHTWILISNFKLAYNMLRRPDGTFNRELAEFLDRKVAANTIPVDGVYSFDVLDRSTNLLNRIYRCAPPETSTSHQPGIGILDLENPLSTTEIVPVVIFFHGGSFTHSSANSAIYDTFCRRLTNLIKGVVVSVNYRRSPEHRYPCAYEDGWEALKWVHSRSWLLSGSDPKVHVFLAGDSSGGNIAHHVAVRAAESGVEVLGNILLHPLFGGEERKESEKKFDGKYFVRVQDRDWYWRAFLPEGEDRDHPACNIFGPRGVNLKGVNFTKSLVVVAGFDLVQDWQLAYVKGLENAGQEVKLLFLEKATIGFYFLPNNEHFYTLMDEIKSFVSP